MGLTKELIELFLSAIDIAELQHLFAPETIAPYELSQDQFDSQLQDLIGLFPDITDFSNLLKSQIKKSTGKTAKDYNNKHTGAFSNIKNAKADLKTANKNLAIGEGTLVEVDSAQKALSSAKMGTAGNILGGVGDVANTIMGLRDIYDSKYGGITQGLDSAYGGIADAVSMIPGVGTLIGGIMKAGSALNNGLQRLGVGTDGLTKKDAILGSDFLALTPLGLANSLGASTTDSFKLDERIYDNIGSSYTGAHKYGKDTEGKVGKYGLFSRKEYKKAQDEINNARRQQQILTDISNTAQTRFDIADSMAAINDNRRKFQMLGGYQLNAVYVGKLGVKLEAAHNMVERIKKLQTGGELSKETEPVVGAEYTYEEPVQEIPDRTIDLLMLYAFAVNPHFIQRMNDEPKILAFDPDGTGTEYGSHYIIGYGDAGDGMCYVFPMITYKLKYGDELVYIDNPEDALNLALLRGDYLEMTPNEANIFGQHYKEYFPEYMERFTDLLRATELQDRLNGTYIERTPIYPINMEPGENDIVIPDWYDMERALYNEPEKEQEGGIIQIPSREDLDNMLENENEISKYQDGGSIIPEGALHAHKHNIELDADITKKGIPVVVEDEKGDITQVAEIERGEIIFSKELTEKLENLQKMYYNLESDNWLKDDAALEAGRLIVEEIITNTEDKTNELLT